MKKLKNVLILSLSLVLDLCACGSPQNRLEKLSQKSDCGVFLNGAGAYLFEGEGLTLKSFESVDNGILKFTFSYVGGSVEELFIASTAEGVKLSALELRPQGGGVPAITLGLATAEKFKSRGWELSSPDGLTSEKSLECIKGSGKQLFLVKGAKPAAIASGKKLTMYIGEITVSVSYPWDTDKLDQIFYLGING